MGAHCNERVDKIVEGCSRCCSAADSSLLHHTECIAALQGGRLDDALQAAATLQQETCDSTVCGQDAEMQDREDKDTEENVVVGKGDPKIVGKGDQNISPNRKSQYLSACLLRLKIETMVSLSCRLCSVKPMIIHKMRIIMTSALPSWNVQTLDWMHPQNVSVMMKRRPETSKPHLQLLVWCALNKFQLMFSRLWLKMFSKGRTLGLAPPAFFSGGSCSRILRLEDDTSTNVLVLRRRSLKPCWQKC
jgi:hypothetical protein